MKKLTNSLLAVTLILSFTACETDDGTMPEDPIVMTTDSTNTTVGDSTVMVADVGNLKQNHIKADGRSEDYLYLTDIGGYNSNGEDYFTLHMTGKNRHLIDFTIKGSELREGNFSLKKFQLGSSPGNNEAVLYAGVDGNNLMDFESSDANSISIKKDANGFFVIKMKPLVGTNRNSWDQVITEPISMHLVTNHTKLTTSNTDGEVFENLKYNYNEGFHAMSNQPSATIGVLPISISFRDYDFSMVSSLPKTTYTLATSEASALDLRNGTALKAVNMGYYLNFRDWPQNYNKTQTIEMELTPKTMIISFTNIEFVNPANQTETKTASGTWEIAR